MLIKVKNAKPFTYKGLAFFCVPRADTAPVKKEKRKETKSIDFQHCFKFTFSLCFFKVYYFCHLVHLLVHPKKTIQGSIVAIWCEVVVFLLLYVVINAIFAAPKETKRNQKNFVL